MTKTLLVFKNSDLTNDLRVYIASRRCRWLLCTLYITCIILNWLRLTTLKLIVANTGYIH